MLRDCLNSQCGGQMRFTGARTTHQEHVLRLFQKYGAMQLTHQGFIDRALAKIETGQVPLHREARTLELVGHRAHFALGSFGFQQVAQDYCGILVSRCALLGQLSDGLRHPEELQRTQGGHHQVMLHGASPGVGQ